jgi:hypothetical protein
MTFEPEKSQRLREIVENVEALEAAKTAEGRATTTKIIGVLQRKARLTLDGWPAHLKSDQREHLEEALCDLQAAQNWLEDPYCGDDCDWHDLLIKVMCAASMVSATFVAKYKVGDKLRDELRDELRKEQAAHARRAKIENPANEALEAAIDRFREPYRRPWKEADRILPDINADLAKAGFAAVTVDKIYRRLSTRLKNAD